MRRRASIVLVHGAGHGGWCWRRVSDDLVSRGGLVFSPTLTGMGERAHLLSADINLGTHVDDVVGLIECEELKDVILCGHSYGGMVINGVAERVTNRIAALVYLDAFNARPGRSAWDYVPEAQKKAIEAKNKGAVINPTSAEGYRVNPADRAWIDRRSTPTPKSVFLTPLPKTDKRLSIPIKVYIEATGWASEILTPFAAAARIDPAWVYHAMPYGHDLMVDAPDEVAQILWDTVRATEGDHA